MFAPFLLLFATISPSTSASSAPSTSIAAPLAQAPAPAAPTKPGDATTATRAGRAIGRSEGEESDRDGIALQRTAQGDHFRVVVHFGSQQAADEALAAAEAAVPYAENVYGPLTILPDARLSIHVYATEKEYLDVEGPIAHGAFARNLAFTDARTTTAHVALQPSISAVLFRQCGLPLQTKRCVAHEAVHLWSQRASPRAQALPFWFAEGAATWAADEALRARGWLDDPMEDPFTSTNALRAQALLARDWLPPLGAIVGGLPGGLTFEERYAVSGLAFGFLRSAANADLFARLRDAARGAGPARDASAASPADASPPDVPAEIARAFESAVGDDEARKRLQTAFDEYVRARKPGWDEAWRSLWAAGDGWVQCAFAETNALAWRTSRSGDAPYSIEGELAILEGPTRQMNVLLARTDDAFVQVSFTADFGVDVFSFDRRRGPDAAWKRLGGAQVATLDVGRFHGFRVEVAAPTITVWLDGKPVCAPVIEGHDWSGPFGIGVLARSSGLWRKIAQKPL